MTKKDNNNNKKQANNDGQNTTQTKHYTDKTLHRQNTTQTRHYTDKTLHRQNTTQTRQLNIAKHEPQVAYSGVQHILYMWFYLICLRLVCTMLLVSTFI